MSKTLEKNVIEILRSSFENALVSVEAVGWVCVQMCVGVWVCVCVCVCVRPDKWLERILGEAGVFLYAFLACRWRHRNSVPTKRKG